MNEHIECDKVTVYYQWDRWILPSYDAIVAHIEHEGTKNIETIEKLVITGCHVEHTANFYYIRH